MVSAVHSKGAVQSNFSLSIFMSVGRVGFGLLFVFYGLGFLFFLSRQIYFNRDSRVPSTHLVTDFFF